MKFIKKSLFCGLSLAFVAAGSAAEAADFNVKDYGAVPSDGRDDTQGFQAAINAAARGGGGRVKVPSGRYDVKSMEMFSGVEIHVTPKARVNASPLWTDYSNPWKWSSAVFYGDRLSGVSFTGGGVIDGRNSTSPTGEGGKRGAHIIHLTNSRNLLVEELTFANAGNYSLRLTGSDDVVLRDLTFLGGYDAINAAFTARVRIEDVEVIDNKDDGIAAHATDNWVIRRLSIDGGPANGLRFGGWNFDARDVLVRNKAEFAIRHLSPAGKYARNPYRTHPGAPGENSLTESGNWFCRNWTVQNCGGLLNYQHGDAFDDGKPVGGTLEFKNIYATGLLRSSTFSGRGNPMGRVGTLLFTDSSLQHVGIDNAIDTRNPYGFFIREVAAAKFFRNTIAATGREPRNVMMAVDTRLLRIDRLKILGQSANPPIATSDIQSVSITNLR